MLSVLKYKIITINDYTYYIGIILMFFPYMLCRYVISIFLVTLSVVDEVFNEEHSIIRHLTFAHIFIMRSFYSFKYTVNVHLSP